MEGPGPWRGFSQRECKLCAERSLRRSLAKNLGSSYARTRLLGANDQLGITHALLGHRAHLTLGVLCRSVGVKVGAVVELGILSQVEGIGKTIIERAGGLGKAWFGLLEIGLKVKEPLMDAGTEFQGAEVIDQGEALIPLPPRSMVVAGSRMASFSSQCPNPSKDSYRTGMSGQTASGPSPELVLFLQRTSARQFFPTCWQRSTLVTIRHFPKQDAGLLSNHARFRRLNVAVAHPRASGALQGCLSRQAGQALDTPATAATRKGPPGHAGRASRTLCGEKRSRRRTC